jgi:CcmD family protein
MKMFNKFKGNKLLMALFFLLLTNNIFGQNSIEMADKLRESGKIYVVVAVLLVIFIGIALMLFTIDKKVRKIEKEIRS